MVWRSKIALLSVLSLCLALTWVRRCDAQQVLQLSLPSGWQKMSASDFAVTIRGLGDPHDLELGFKRLSWVDRDAAKAYGEQLFQQANFANGELNYQTIEVLHWLSQESLGAALIEKARQGLISRQDRLAGMPYEELRAKVATVSRLANSSAPANRDSALLALSQEIQGWIHAGGDVSQVPVADLSYAIVRQLTAHPQTDGLQLINGSFTVTWEGVVNPPQSGNYVFEVSPINVNLGFKTQAVKFSMVVAVNGQTILDLKPPVEKPKKRKSQPDNAVRPSLKASWDEPVQWINESPTVSLTVGQAVPLKVTATVEAVQDFPAGLLHALLSWKLPGSPVSTIIPEANLMASTGGSGLTATYSWTASGQAKTLTRTEPNIDIAWTEHPLLLGNDISANAQVADTLWNTVTAPSFISNLASTSKSHPFLILPNESSAALTTARRAAFLDLLLQNPVLLDQMDSLEAVSFFEAFRIGAPDKALEVFGVWATRNPNCVADISTSRSFNGEQRFAYAAMATLTTQQLPGQAATLLSNYLLLPGGECSLPIAYISACSYLGRERFGDWLKLLDDKLADQSIVGDARVNWLLARSNATELSPSSAMHYPEYYAAPFLEPGRGYKFLADAQKAAQSSPVKLRVAMEIVSRQVHRRSYSAAKTILQAIVDSLAAKEKSIVANLQRQLDASQAISQQIAESRPAEAQKSYLVELKRRRDQAAQRGNSTAVNRYDSLIGAATKSPTQSQTPQK